MDEWWIGAQSMELLLETWVTHFAGQQEQEPEGGRM